MKVTGLHIYPVKSGRGIALDAAVVRPRGFDCDRRWMVVDADGRFLTQREHPNLATLSATIDGVLTWGDDHVQMTATPMRKMVEVWGDRVDALDMGDAAAKFVSTRLEVAARVVCMDHDSRRTIDASSDTPDELSFADGYPYLLTTLASLDDLNRRLDEPVSMARFRPNIVVDGGAAFEEDDWRWLRIGDVRFEVVSGCARCVVTTVDQGRGVTAGKEPLKTLSTFRRGEEGVYFGMNLIARGRGIVHVGDPVLVE